MQRENDTDVIEVCDTCGDDLTFSHVDCCEKCCFLSDEEEPHFLDLPREYNFDSMENFKDTYTEDEIRESLMLDEALFTKNRILALCPECGHMIHLIGDCKQESMNAVGVTCRCTGGGGKS